MDEERKGAVDVGGASLFEVAFSYAFSTLSDSKSFILADRILLVSRTSLCLTSISFNFSFTASLSIFKLSELKDSLVTAMFDFLFLTVR